MYALRVASLYPPRSGLGWTLAPAHRRHPTASFTGPLWRAQCGCGAGSPHEDLPAVGGTCGLYALVRGKLVMGPHHFAFRAAGAPSGGKLLYRSFAATALILVEALGRTCHGEMGVIRSAMQVPQVVLPHYTNLGMGDRLFQIWPGLAEDLAARYQCDVVGWHEFQRRLRRLVPGVAVCHVREGLGPCTR